MDLQVKLANDGYVQQASITARGLPDWAIWRNEILGFTPEPAKKHGSQTSVTNSGR